MDYRREIDGLRALAVLPVILFHAGFKAFSGGFVGVEVFFVISGYLITSIILAEKQAGTFTLVNFYQRRARRILPALFVVMFACLPFAWLLMNPHQLKEFSQSLVAVSLFSSNILFWKQSDYFDAEASLKPLLHTWSLGIEEQYYLFFPILVILAWRIGKGRVFTLLFAAAIISLWLAQIGSSQNPEATFYLLPTRAWELLIGSFLAFGFTKMRNIDFSLLLKQLMSFFGFISIILSIFYLDTKTPFPSIYALPATLGAACVILFGTKETYVGALLSSRLLVGVGLVSYSVYLWHQPILAFLKILNQNNELTAFQYSIYFLLTFALAFVTYRLIETPFRRSQFTGRILFVFALLGSVVFIFIGFLGHQTKGFLELKLSGVPIERRAILVDVAKERSIAEGLIYSHSSHLAQASFGGSPSARKIVFIGDSMARDLSTALVENSRLYPNYEFRLLPQSNDCLYTTAKLEKACIDAFANIFSSSLLRDADLVVVTFLWKEDADFNMVEEFLSSVKKANSNVLLLGSAGFIDMASVTYDLTRLNKSFTQDELDRVVFGSRRLKFDRGNISAQKVSRNLDIQYFDRKDFYCDYKLSQCRMITLEGGSLLWDNAHLSAHGMRVTADKMARSGLLKTNLVR